MNLILVPNECYWHALHMRVIMFLNVKRTGEYKLNYLPSSKG